MKRRDVIYNHLNKVLVFTIILLSFNLNAQFYTLEHIRASDDVVLGTITDGTSITTASTTTFSINAIPSSSIGSTIFSLTGPVSHNQTESVAPYALYGDASGNFTSTTNLIAGSYTLTVTAWSASGGTGTQIAQDIINFTVADSTTDTQDPISPVLSSTSQTETTVDLSWTAATDNVAVTGYKIYKDSVLEATLGNVLTYQVTGLTAATLYGFTVKAIDAAANESLFSNTVSITTDTSNSQTLLPLRINSGGPETNYNGNVFLADQYFNGGEVGNFSASNTSLSILHVNERYGTYSYNIPVNDGLYNVILHFIEAWFTASGGRVFDVKIEGTLVLDNYDIYQDVGHDQAVSKSFNNITVNDGVLNLEFSADGSGGEVNNAKLSGFEVLSSTTNTDTQSPTAPTLSSTSQTETTVGLSWSAATDDVAVTGYKVYKDGVLETTLGNVLTYQVTGLTTNTLYNFTITALDAAANESVVSNLVSVTTDSSTNTQTPTAPTLSSTSQTETTVDLSWTASVDNTYINDYKVYKNGIYEAALSGQTRSYQVTGLTASTSYDFTVIATNSTGDLSPISNVLSVTTNSSVGTSSGNWILDNQDMYYTNGNVGIGTTIPDSKLTVKGSIHSEEVKVDLSVPAPDYVFVTDYNLTPLDKLQEYIKAHKHLPNIPSAKYMEANGVQLGIMNMKLLEKIEELTLYTLQQQKELKSQKEKNQRIENRLINLERLIESIKK